MKYVEAPQFWQGEGRGIFLAGGITGCPDWQSSMFELLTDPSMPADLVVLNPRQRNFPMGDPQAAVAQITWEHVHLRRAQAILFWFPRTSICPIALYELGAWTMTDKPIAVGIEPGYERTVDVQIQTGLARPEVAMVNNLHALAHQTRELIKAMAWRS